MLKSCFEDKSTQIATLVKAFSQKEGWEALANPNAPKVVLNKQSEALYFSRSVIPYLRHKKPEEWLSVHTFYKHIGIYAYRRDVLAELARLPMAELEGCESLEQLRWLENGYVIKTALTDTETIAVDTPEDLQRILNSTLLG